MADEVIRSLMLDVHAHPEAFDPAPADKQGAAIEQRRLHEDHVCKACGNRARVAYITASRLRPETGPRWLDLCPECARRLRIELDRIETDPDATDAFLETVEGFRG